MSATLSTNFLGRALKVNNKVATAARPALPARAPVVTKALFTSKKAAPKKVRFVSFFVPFSSLPRRVCHLKQPPFLFENNTSAHF